MKKLLLLTIALLALGATVASAQDGTITLAWGTSCHTAVPNAAQDNQSKERNAAGQDKTLHGHAHAQGCHQKKRRGRG